MNEHELRVLTSSKSSEWETPDDLFAGLDESFCFTLDPASTHVNAKCKKHFTLEENGLEQSWKGETVFLNPPYGRTVGKWIEKAYLESQKCNLPKVLLLPARPDTVAWSKYCSKAGNIFFIKGRLKFNNRALPSYKEDNSHKVSPATFPSAIVVFEKGREGKRNVKWTNKTFSEFW